MYECCSGCGGLLAPSDGRCFICGVVGKRVKRYPPLDTLNSDDLMRMFNDILSRIEALEDRLEVASNE